MNAPAKKKRTEIANGENKPRQARSPFGRVRQNASGTWSAAYPDPRNGGLIRAPHTFDTKQDADGWLSQRRAEVQLWQMGKREAWSPAAGQPEPEPDPAPLFAEYAEKWVSARLVKGRPIAPRTSSEYRRMLAKLLSPVFGHLRLDEVTRERVLDWHATLAETPNQRAKVYSFARTMMKDAVVDKLIPENPFRIKGAGSVENEVGANAATMAELSAIYRSFPEPYRALVLLVGFIGCRPGEAAELRRQDVDLERGVVHIRRGVTFTTGEVHAGAPKSRAGVREVAIPPHVLPLIREHLKDHVGRGQSALMFPAVTDRRKHLRSSTVNRWWAKAKKAAGRTDSLRFYDLRATAGTYAAQAGATTKELMLMLGHTTASVAMVYQRAAQGRAEAVADAVSEIAVRDGWSA